MIIAISGSGRGSGKTTLAEKVADEVWSIAGLLRKDLKVRYPDYDWYNKSQKYKDTTVVKETGKTIRTMLFEEGQKHSSEDPAYWVRLLIGDLNARMRIADGPKNVAIDDVRKVEELQALRDAFPLVIHMHVVSPGAIEEPEFDNAELNSRSDYVCQW